MNNERVLYDQAVNELVLMHHAELLLKAEQAWLTQSGLAFRKSRLSLITRWITSLSKSVMAWRKSNTKLNMVTEEVEILL